MIEHIEIMTEDGRMHSVRADQILWMKSLRSNEDDAPLVLVSFGEDKRDRVYTRESYESLKAKLDERIASAREMVILRSEAA